jgi:hypothetical protein
VLSQKPFVGSNLRIRHDYLSLTRTSLSCNIFEAEVLTILLGSYSCFSSQYFVPPNGKSLVLEIAFEYGDEYGTENQAVVEGCLFLRFSTMELCA